jgi:demethylmenaquinone methyltransferase/2-methoxy-6-polyprenyl-1,4-benzoquinol methylase
MTDIDAYLQRLLAANPLREPLFRSVIQALQFPAGSHGLDVGCGIGLQSLLLAEAVGEEGQVTGVDIVPEFLAWGEKLAGQTGLSERIRFQRGDMNRLPFAEATFDWAWSADCIGYPAGELVLLLEELKRVIKPGGSIIILAWTSQQVLPGYPLLEAELNATCSAYLPFLKGKAPELHFLRALQGFQDAGLEEVKAQTFVGEVQAPLSRTQHTALASLFEMLWVEPDLRSEAWTEYQRLCNPESSDFILDQPGYYGFFTYSLFRGRVPQE